MRHLRIGGYIFWICRVKIRVRIRVVIRVLGCCRLLQEGDCCGKVWVEIYGEMSLIKPWLDVVFK